MDFIITAGEKADCKQAVALLQGKTLQHVLADKAYDTDEIIAYITENGGEAVIPPKKNRKEPREYDKELYKERNLIERCFSKLKNFRKFATRFEKNIQNFTALVALACIMLLLK